jgi:hypothetical protein
LFADSIKKGAELWSLHKAYSARCLGLVLAEDQIRPADLGFLNRNLHFPRLEVHKQVKQLGQGTDVSSRGLKRSLEGNKPDCFFI